MRLYEVVAQNIGKRISNGVLRSGDKLPSIRQMAQETGCSVITVQKAYELLESQGICISRSRSGFFVSESVVAPQSVPRAPEPSAKIPLTSISRSNLIYWENRRNYGFGSILPSGDLFNRDPIDRILRQLLRRGSNRISSYHYPEGDTLLKQTISARLAHRNIFVSPDELVITRSASSGFNLCIDTFTVPGDAVLVESPTYLPMIAGLDRRGLRAVEIQSHAESGVDPVEFERTLESSGARVCILVAANHYPTGVTYSPKTMKGLVDIAARHGSIIIENDLFTELTFEGPTHSLKEFDEAGVVIQFSSFGFQVHPEYGIGWITAGSYAPMVLATQYVSGLQGNDGALQRAIAEYMDGSHGHERELRKKRDRLAQRLRHGTDILMQHLPASFKVSRPRGGYMCWVEGPSDFDSTELLDDVASQDLNFFPGPLFSISGANSCSLALNLSYEWTPFREQELIRLCSKIAERQ